MRHRTIRVILAIWIAMIAFAGLYVPATAFVPLSVDVSDGYTFSGVQRTIKTGAVEEFIENPIGPFSPSGDRGFVQLSWNKGLQDSFLNCDPTRSIRSVSETIQNRQTNHYSVDLSGTSGRIESIYLGVPSFQNAGIGTTAEFPLDQVAVDILYIDDQGQQGSGTMTQVPPQAGDAVGFLLTFNPFLENHNILHVDASFTGEVDPPVSGNPQTAPLGCPAPNEDLEELTDFGVTQLFLNDVYVVLYVDEEPVNVAPVFDLIDPVTINEGQTRIVDFSVTDADGSVVTVTVVDPFQFVGEPILNPDGSGSVSLTPGFDDSGSYQITLEAEDNDGNTAQIAFDVTVENTNRAPVVSAPDQVELSEGEQTTIPVDATDPDGDAVVVTFEGPDFCLINGDGDLACDPPFGASGQHEGVITANDNGDPPQNDLSTITFNVNNVNRSPVIDPFGNQEVVQGQTAAGTITATDPDGDAVTFSVTGPSFCTLTNNGDNTATLECVTTNAPSGTHQVTITASDGTDQSSLTFNLLILPDVDAGGPYSVVRGQTVQLSAAGPANGTYAWDLDGNGSFETSGQTVTFNSAGRNLGAHEVTVRVTSFDGTTSNTDSATVNVLAGPNPPQLTPIPNRPYTEGFPITFRQAVHATDPDGDPIELSATISPQTVSFGFVDFGNGSGEVSVSNTAEPGIYTVTVTASDGGQSVSTSFTLTVGPEITVGGPFQVPVGGSVEITPFSLYASEFSYDVDGDGVSEGTGSSFTFDAAGRAPGDYFVTVTGCLPGGQVCTSELAQVTVETLDLVTYDQLQSLTRDAVDSFIVERVLLTALGLAEFFDQLGAERAARALLEAFIRLVTEFRSALLISFDNAEQLIGYAESLLAQLPE